ncbi:MAG: exo-alpha-sialidase [Ignavibacteria bacterium]|nr:exo-alpha-sialidase [Ignavibacteria bacterium]
MKKFTSKNIVSLISVCLLSCGANEVYAQVWNALPPVYGTYHHSGEYLNTGMHQSSDYDTCNRQFIVEVGTQVISSSDAGMTWYHKPFHELLTTSGRIAVLSSDCEQYAYWTDYSRNVELRLARFRKATNEWELVTPIENVDFLHVGIVGKSIFVGGSNATPNCYVSSDGGTNWSLHNLNNDSRLLNSYVLEPRQNVIAVATSEGWREIIDGTDTLQLAPLPENADCYVYSGERTIITGISTRNSADKLKLAVSQDSGSTWKYFDSVTCVNTGRVIGGAKSRAKDFLVLGMRNSNSNVVTIWFYYGDVVSSTDGGQTWWDRNVPGFKSDANPIRQHVIRHVLKHSDESCSFPFRGRLAKMPADVTKPMVYLSRNLEIKSLAYADGVYIAGTPFCLLRSTDQGNSWYQTGIAPDLVEWSNVPYRGLHYVVSEQIFPVDSTEVYGACAQTGHQWKYNGVIKNWEAQSTFNVQATVIQAIDDEADETRLVYHTQPIYSVRPEGTELYTGSSLKFVSANSDSTKQRSPIFEPYRDINRVTHYEDLSASVKMYTGDTMYVSQDSGRTFHFGGVGLPLDKQKQLVNCSGVVLVSNGELVAGFRGRYDQTDTGIAALNQGGMYRSADTGRTWQRSNHNLDTNLCVWYMSSLGGTDTVLAAVGTITRKFIEGYNVYAGYTMSDGRIIRSTDGGTTWHDVFLETRSHPGFTGRREILIHPDGRILVATMEDGVIESFDGGATWKTLGNEDLLGRFINDIAIDTMGIIYASTDRGIFYIKPDPVTSVEEINEPTPVGFLTLYAYPTPARANVRIRVNNLPLAMQAGGWTTLKLYSLMGTAEADLTQQLQQQQHVQPQASMLEFDMPTDALHGGVYLLVLETALGPRTMKILINKN